MYQQQYETTYGESPNFINETCCKVVLYDVQFKPFTLIVSRACICSNVYIQISIKRSKM